MFSQLVKNGATSRKKGEYEEGRGKGLELNLDLRIYIL
jgi:hypothetical protein